MRPDNARSADGPVTVVNVFEVPAAEVDEFAAQWRIRAQLMAGVPGFRGSRLHKALSTEARFQLVNVANWASRADLEAAQAAPEFQAQIRALAESGQARYANPALYEVVVDLEPR